MTARGKLFLIKNMKSENNPYKDFIGGTWEKEINVRDFIQRNYTPYIDDDSFLSPISEKTKKLWEKVSNLQQDERRKGILDADTDIISAITSHQAGYIDRDLELITGLQTDKPLKRGIMPAGGLRMVKKGLAAYGYHLSPEIEKIYTDYRKSHNEGVFSAYTDEMKKARNSGIITGLPDAYGRGRIIGDYRRVPLYGIKRLLLEREEQRQILQLEIMDENNIRALEELNEQMKSLLELQQLGSIYSFDLSRPAENSQEAIQWLYLSYLATCKEQNGAAMSIGRISTFLDIYLERDLKNQLIDETAAQELIDQLVIKLRIIRFLRTPDYDELFSGDPVWITEAIGGMGSDGRTLVTKTSFRFLHTLTLLGPAPEPNLTILWSPRLPAPFKEYCANQSIATSAIQYENDELMRPVYGDDYGIACCVSAMKIGKQMQFFGARANLAKALLYAINGGRDELTGEQIGPKLAPLTDEILNYEIVYERFSQLLDWLARLYINTLNVIHYMHDRYAYERLQMALHDREIIRTMACGLAGLSVATDSLSAIKYARVKPIRNGSGLVTDYEIMGEYPAFGNNDDRADSIASDLVKLFMNKLRGHKTYRKSVPTLSILTITSNIVYGKKTGATPDGRNAGDPFAPGANPMHGRDQKGAIASLASVAKLPYQHAEDGISYTFSIVPAALGKTMTDRKNNLTSIIDGYFTQGGHHINVNVFDRETLLDAMEHPEVYPQLTVRVSGYAVNFTKLNREQQLDVINRTFHEHI